tara:strand:- start:645 stop:1874 length:1230 start_codon:yes stop_codon:yes gene_type:complete
MARNRVIYQSEALYVSKDASSVNSGDHAQLERVQSANYSFNINRQDVNQYGTLARIGTEIIEPPTVSADFSYYLTNGFNEKALNFLVQTGYNNSGNFPSGHMVGGSGQNLYILTVAEGEDADDETMAAGNQGQFVGIGNCYISDYTVDLAVGALPTVSVTMEGSNVTSDVTVVGENFEVYSGITSPAVNQESGTSLGFTVDIPFAKSGIIMGEGIGTLTGLPFPVALRPADVTVSLGTLSDDSMVVIDGSDEAHIQSCSISLPLSRTPLNRLGSKFAYARTVDFPIAATMSINAIVNEQKALDLSARLDEFDQKEISVIVKNPKASGKDLAFNYDTNNNRAIAYTFKGASLDNTSISSSIGANKSVDLTFSTEIGGVNDAEHGIFVHVSSGIPSGDGQIYGPTLIDNYA